MFILIGGVGYARLDSPTALDIEKRADYAEHSVVEGKPILQYMGPSLDRVDLLFTFHSDYIDPQAAWDELCRMLESGMAFPVLMGTGVYLGMFVLSSLNRITTGTTPFGELRSIDCRVRLEEYVDPEPLETRQAEQQSSAKAVKATGKSKPNSKTAEVPAVAGSGDYKSVEPETIVRQ